MEKKKYYVECEEGASQYDEYDLTNQNIVSACYVKAKVKEDEGNLYIEALPYPREEKDIYRAYSRSFASYSYDSIKKMTKLEKMLMCHKVTHKKLIDNSPLFRKNFKVEFHGSHTNCVASFA